MAAPIVIDRAVEVTDYPLADPGGPSWRAVVDRVRRDLHDVGCSVLPDFVSPVRRDELRRQSEAVAPRAYHGVETVNAYNTAPDPTLPADHPAHLTTERGNAFVTRDRIPADAVVARLYTSPTFQRFVAECFALPRLHELADPLSGLTLNVVDPGHEHPWHFDVNEFTVSLLTRAPEAGGAFEYCPGIRSAGAENLDDVRAVLTGRDDHLVRRLPLRPGDLQLFAGRYALHRVTPVVGATARHSAIFAYSERPGVIGSVARTRQLFGRVAPEHLDAERHRRARADDLMD